MKRQKVLRGRPYDLGTLCNMTTVVFVTRAAWIVWSAFSFINTVNSDSFETTVKATNSCAACCREWKLGNWQLLDRLWPMTGKALILEKRSWELFDSQRLSVLYCCCWWISLLSQWQSTLATWHFTLLYKTTIHRLHHAVTHRNALGFNHLFTIELWILAPLARSHWDTL